MSLSPDLEKAWKDYMRAFAPIKADSREWEAFKFAWDAAMQAPCGKMHRQINH